MKGRKKIIYIKSYQITCTIKGRGSIPCIVLGAAGLFAKTGVFPEKLNKIFTFYFADMWDKSSKLPISKNKTLNWNSIVNEIDEIRKQLNLEKAVVFGHSGGGALALEYVRRFPEHCLFAIIIAFSPNWTHSHKKVVKDFIQKNANKLRKISLLKGNNDFSSKKEYLNEEQLFIQKFHSSYALLLKNYQDASIKNKIKFMWNNYHPNVIRIIAFFELLASYNFFERKFNNIFIPIFWGMGMYDFFSPYTEFLDGMKKDKKIFNNIEYYIFRNSGHYPMIEDPNDFSIALINFSEKIFLHFNEHKL